MAIDLAEYGKKNGIKYFMISYTDLFGYQRAKLVPTQAIADMQTDGAGFAGFASLHILYNWPPVKKSTLEPAEAVLPNTNRNKIRIIE